MLSVTAAWETDPAPVPPIPLPRGCHATSLLQSPQGSSSPAGHNPPSRCPRCDHPVPSRRPPHPKQCQQPPNWPPGSPLTLHDVTTPLKTFPSLPVSLRQKPKSSQRPRRQNLPTSGCSRTPCSSSSGSLRCVSAAHSSRGFLHKAGLLQPQGFCVAPQSEPSPSLPAASPASDLYSKVTFVGSPFLTTLTPHRPTLPPAKFSSSRLSLIHFVYIYIFLLLFTVCLFPLECKFHANNGLLVLACFVHC